MQRSFKASFIKTDKVVSELFEEIIDGELTD